MSILMMSYYRRIYMLQSYRTLPRTCCSSTLSGLCCGEAVARKRKKGAANYENYHLLPNVERSCSPHGALDGLFRASLAFFHAFYEGVIAFL